MLKRIDGLCEIDFYELNKERADAFVKALSSTLSVKKQADVFISYSTKNQAEADGLADFLNKNRVSFWMAPKSIPPTSNCIKEISKALSNVSIILLVLTEEAEESAWVPSEVSSAKGAKKVLFGYKPYEFEVNDEFAFLFQRSQIYEARGGEDCDGELIKIIKTELDKRKP